MTPIPLELVIVPWTAVTSAAPESTWVVPEDPAPATTKADVGVEEGVTVRVLVKVGV